MSVKHTNEGDPWRQKCDAVVATKPNMPWTTKCIVGIWLNELTHSRVAGYQSDLFFAFLKSVANTCLSRFEIHGLVCPGQRLRLALCLVVLIFSSVSHCADAAAQAPDQKSPVLAGHWASIGCEAATPTVERSIRRDFVFSDWSWQVDVTLYEGARCATPLASIRIEGSYVISGASGRIAVTVSQSPPRFGAPARTGGDMVVVF
jgi:hypothetical protein